jgi:hypothetical protein
MQLAKLTYTTFFDRMFNLFRKKKKHIQLWEYEMLKKVAEVLPHPYSFIANQVHPNSLIDAIDHPVLKNDWRMAKYSADMYKRHSQSPKSNGRLIGIKIFDLNDQDYKEIELDLYDGVLIGYRIQTGKYDLERIDIGNLHFKPFQSEDKLEYEAALKDLKCEHLELDNGFEIELSGKTYYTIKDLEDGNYIAIDKKGKVYGMFHDPFVIEPISSDLATFIEQLNNGSFSIDEYYRSKIA